MNVMDIRLLGDPCLRAKSAPVKQVGPVERLLIASMFATVEQHKGIGLAAPQVGINRQIFIVDTGKESFAAINPRILKRSGSDMMEEGCLSIPGLLADVKRPEVVWVEFLDAHDQLVKTRLDGLAARVFQHEHDHLNGILILDYLTFAQQKKVMALVKDGVYVAPSKEADAKRATKI